MVLVSTVSVEPRRHNGAQIFHPCGLRAPISTDYAPTHAQCGPNLRTGLWETSLAQDTFGVSTRIAELRWRAPPDVVSGGAWLYLCMGLARAECCARILLEWSTEAPLRTLPRSSANIKIMSSGRLGNRVLSVGVLSEAATERARMEISRSLARYGEPLVALGIGEVGEDLDTAAAHLLDELLSCAISVQELEALEAVAAATYAGIQFTLFQGLFGRLLLVNRRRHLSEDVAITYQAAAAYLGVSTSSVQRMVNDGTLPRLTTPSTSTTRTKTISLFAVADIVGHELGLQAA